MLESGRFIFGPEVEAFEREAAAFLGVPHAIGVANGTDALVLALDALGIGRGDEVICPSFTFYATAEAIARVGATPVFADIDPVTLNLDPEDVAARITPRTKAIMPVHLFGRPAPLAELAALGLPLIEDAAQAFGADGVAQTGICSTFSFFPTKNLFALGDGGLVTCLDDEVAERVRMLRFHGSRDKKTFELVGTNSRLDAVQAAMLRVFLPRLAGWNAARREAAARYAELGLGELVELPVDEPGHVYHMYVVRSSRRAEIAEALAAAGIASASYYVTPTPSPARDGVPRRRRRVAARDRARRRGEPRPSDVGRHRPRAAGARRRRRSLGRRRPRVVMRSPVNRHRLWQVAVDAALIAAAWVLVLVRPLRRRLAALLRPLPRVGRRRARRRDHAPRLHRVRLLQPLVALRLDAGHVGRAARRRGRRRRRVPRVRGARLPPGEGAARDLGHRPPAPARVRDGRAPARADAHRAPVRALDRRARQGGADRRCRRRGAADPPRDAAQPVARLHADRARRRRPAQEEPPAPRRSACSGRPPSCPSSSASDARTSCSSRSRRPSGDVRERIVEIGARRRRSR